MSGFGLALRQVRFENKAFWRNPPAAAFTFGFPVMFLFLFTVLFGNNETVLYGRTVKQSNFYVPSICAFSVITACYTNIAMSLAFARDEGVLKRKRGTPIPPWAYMGGRVLHSCLIALLLVAIVITVGVVFLGIEPPTATLPAFLVSLVVGAGAFSSLAFAIASVIPNADAAPAIVNISILPLLFISDIFIPLREAPAWLKSIADIFPIRHYAQAMLASFNPLPRASGFQGDDLLVVAVWGLAGLLFASRYFSWEPRR